MEVVNCRVDEEVQSSNILIFTLNYLLQRNFIREVSLEQAKKLKDFWASFYSWKTTQWPNGIMPEDWQQLRTADAASYDEE
jgi:hypothetical protein